MPVRDHHRQLRLDEDEKREHAEGGPRISVCVSKSGWRGGVREITISTT